MTAADSKDIKAERVMADLRNILPDKYHNMRMFREGGTRTCFIADWGPGDEKRIIKVDKTPESPRALRHVARGCDTENDIIALSQVKDPEKHNLVRFCDYFEMPAINSKKTDAKIGISVESFFSSLSLEEMVQRAPLKTKEFEAVFSKVIEGVSYLMKEAEMFHRDLKPSNILISEAGEKNKKDIEVRITDFANACRIKDVSKKFLPTAGGHFVMDPLIIGEFTGEERSYSKGSELYAIGTNMLFALTGKYLFEYDPDNKKAEILPTGTSLLDWKGEVDAEKHESALDSTLAKLPRHSRKYASIIKKCMTLDESLRYSGIEELTDDFNKKSRPGFFEKIKNSWKTIAATSLLIATMAASSSWFIYTQTKRNNDMQANLQAKIAENEKYLVVSEWNGTGLEIKNNLAELEVKVRNYDHTYESIFPREEQGTFVMPGDKLDVYVGAKLLPIPEKTGGGPPALKGKIYFEGFTSQDFGLQPGLHDQSYRDEFTTTIGYAYEVVEIPKELKEGTFILAVELYAPKNNNQDYARFSNPGKAISRKRIPIVVGKSKEQIYLQEVGVSSVENHISFHNVDEYEGDQIKMMPEGIEFEMSVPGKGIRRELPESESNTNSYYESFNLPEKKSGEMTLQVVAREKGKIIGYSFVPIEARRLSDNYSIWKLGMPGKDFSEKLIEYRKKIFAEKK